MNIGHSIVEEGKIGRINGEEDFSIDNKNLSEILEQFKGKNVRLSITEIDVCSVCGSPIVREIEVTTHASPSDIREYIMLCKDGHQTPKQEKRIP